MYLFSILLWHNFLITIDIQDRYPSCLSKCHHTSLSWLVSWGSNCNAGRSEQDSHICDIGQISCSWVRFFCISRVGSNWLPTVYALFMFFFITFLSLSIYWCCTRSIVSHLLKGVFLWIAIAPFKNWCYSRKGPNFGAIYQLLTFFQCCTTKLHPVMEFHVEVEGENCKSHNCMRHHIFINYRVAAEGIKSAYSNVRTLSFSKSMYLKFCQ